MSPQLGEPVAPLLIATLPKIHPRQLGYDRIKSVFFNAPDIEQWRGHVFRFSVLRLENRQIHEFPETDLRFVNPFKVGKQTHPCDGDQPKGVDQVHDRSLFVEIVTVPNFRPQPDAPFGQEFLDCRLSFDQRDSSGG